MECDISGARKFGQKEDLGALSKLFEAWPNSITGIIECTTCSKLSIVLPWSKVIVLQFQKIYRGKEDVLVLPYV